MNPILGMMNQNNPLNQIFSMMQGGMNPNKMLDMMMQRNPQAAQYMEQLKTSGQNPKDIAMNLCKQHGIDENQVMEMAKKFGMK